MAKKRKVRRGWRLKKGADGRRLLYQWMFHKSTLEKVLLLLHQECPVHSSDSCCLKIKYVLRIVPAFSYEDNIIARHFPAWCDMQDFVETHYRTKRRVAYTDGIWMCQTQGKRKEV